MSNSTGNSAVTKPKKPYPDFPLTPHASGAWQKKIRGKVHYFGRWGRTVKGKLQRLPGDGWQQALALYKGQADDLHAGRTPRVARDDGLTIADLCNRFLTAKAHKLRSGELVARTFGEYQQTTDLLCAQFCNARPVDDLAAEDFETLRNEMPKQWGPIRLGNVITRIKSVFKYGLDNGLLEKQVRYGSEFTKPGKALLRKLKANNGSQMLEARECRALIDAAPAQPKAMLLLALNCGFGNHDCATLPEDAVALEKGCVVFPRPKTGIERRCPLWPETVQALREAIAVRPEPREENARGLVFVTARGRQFLSGGIAKPVTCVISDLMKAVGVHRPGLGFYTLRHTFRTVADTSRDFPAIDLVMGHADHTMGGHYRERIDGARLQAVVDVVRDWLFAPWEPTPHEE